MNQLFAPHPQPANLVINSLLLRYVDARPFDHQRLDVLAFLRTKMHVDVSLPTSLLAQPGIRAEPQQFTMQISFTCSEPPGAVAVGFATGQRDDEPAIVWETLVHSTDGQIPPMPQRFADWIDAAHIIAHDWFIKLIEGDLLQEFQE